MRLGQLARKLAIKPTAIKEYLEKQGVPFEGTSNHKVPDEYVDEIIAHFSPDIPEEIIEEPAVLPTDTSVEASDDGNSIVADYEDGINELPTVDELKPDTDDNEQADEELVEVPNKNETLAEPTDQTLEPATDEEEPPAKEVVLTVQEILEKEETSEEEDSEESTDEEEIDDQKILIKAPKVSLPGLKVVGKIDLPEPVQKQDKTENNETAGEEDSDDLTKRKTSEKDRSRRRRDGRKPKRNKRRPLTLEEKRERERRAAERKKIALQKKIKDEKKQHYLNQVKNTPSKPKKVKKEKAQPVRVDKGPPPKTILGKFWRWLNT